MRIARRVWAPRLNGIARTWLAAVLGCAECAGNALAGVDALTECAVAGDAAADGDAPDNNAVDGDVADGDAADGDAADGVVADGDVADGDAADGVVPDDDVPDDDAAGTGARSSTPAARGARRISSRMSDSSAAPGSSTHSPTLATIRYPNRGTFAM